MYTSALECLVTDGRWMEWNITGKRPSLQITFSKGRFPMMPDNGGTWQDIGSPRLTTSCLAQPHRTPRSCDCLWGTWQTACTDGCLQIPADSFTMLLPRVCIYFGFLAIPVDSKQLVCWTTTALLNDHGICLTTATKKKGAKPDHSHKWPILWLTITAYDHNRQIPHLESDLYFTSEMLTFF